MTAQENGKYDEQLREQVIEFSDLDKADDFPIR